MLREKLKHFRTIKLKRHHYILGGFGAAAIIAFTSIFGFQNIGTHAKTYDPSIAIPDNNICTVINDTQVDVNGTGEINVYCRLGVCVYPELPVPNTGLHYNSDIINVYNNGSATCLVACDEGNEGNEGSEGNEGIQLRTDCNSTINPDDFKDLQYDNVFTFTFQGISAGTSDIRLLANSFQGTGGGNNAADGQEITVRGMETSPGKTGCKITISNRDILVDEGGTAIISCNGLEISAPKSIPASYITYNPLVIDLSSNATCDGNDDFVCTFYYTGIGAGTSPFILKANLIGDVGEVDGGEIEVSNKPSLGGPTCSIIANPETLNVTQHGEIIVTCTGESKSKPTFDSNLIAATNALDYSQEIITVTKDPSQNLEYEEGPWKLTLVYDFEGSKSGESKLGFYANVIADDYGRNGAVQGKSIVVTDDVILCAWNKSLDTPIDQYTTGSIGLTCSSGSATPNEIKGIMAYKALILGIEDVSTPQEFATANGVQYNYTVTYKGLHEGTGTLSLSGRIANGTLVTDNGEVSPMITVGGIDAPNKPIACNIVADPDTVNVDATGQIIVTCESSKLNDYLGATGLEYEPYYVEIQDKAPGVYVNGNYEYRFTYTGLRAIQNSTLNLKAGVLTDGVTLNDPASYANGITVDDTIPDCLEDWNNDYFITPQFWAKDPTPAQIACALYGSGGKDQTAYTMGWSGYKGGESCLPYYSMTVVTGASLPTTLSGNTIYVLTSTGFTRTDKVLLPGCSAIISNQLTGNDTTIKFRDIQGIGFDNSSLGTNNYSIIDNVSIYGANGNGNYGIYMDASSTTLNVVRVYNRKDGIFIDGGSYNILNNVQVYGNENGIRVKAKENAINNTQIYRNDVGLHFDHSDTNMVYNVEIYQNSTGLDVGEASTMNTFYDVELLNNKFNLYVLSGLELQNVAEGTLRQNPVTKVDDFVGQLSGEDTKLTSMISGFDRVLLKSDLERRYRFECEGGISATYTGINQLDLTGAGTAICSGEHRGDYIGIHSTGANWGNYTVIETRSLLTNHGVYKYDGYSYPNNMTNPRNVNGIYFNDFFFASDSMGNATVVESTEDYSYGFNINQQKDVKLRNLGQGGLVNTKYFVGSNVVKYTINGEYKTHTKVHYTVTGTAETTLFINKYNIQTKLYTGVDTTITFYDGPNRTKTIVHNIENQINGIDINSGVDLYVRTGDTTDYPVVVQMYGEDRDLITDHKETTYFAEHKYVTTLTRKAPTFIIEPGNMCTNAAEVNMTGTWTGFEYNMTGFDFDDIRVEGGASKVTGSFAAGADTGVYRRRISLSGGEGRVYVVGNTSEDILEFGNAQSEIRTYNRDIYGPVIVTEGFTIPECTRKILDVDAHDVGCKGMKDYKLEGALGNIGWQSSSIFRISADTIGRIGGITKTGLIYARDGFDNTKTGIIVGTITDILPTVTYDQSTNPYPYSGTINGSTTVSNIISLLGANEGACGVADLIVESVDCGVNASGSVGANNSITVDPTNNTDITCSVVIKDNENNRKTGYIKFTANGIQSTTYNCHWDNLTSPLIRQGDAGQVSLVCDGINFSQLTSQQITQIKNHISLTNAGILSYTVGNTMVVSYNGAQVGETKFKFNGFALDATTTLSDAESQSIKVYNISGCAWQNPVENPIGEGVGAHIDLLCDEFQYHSENANDFWSVISYSGTTNAINTGTAEWLSNGIRLFYTGRYVGNIQLLASGDSQGYLYNSNGRSPTIKVIDYDSNRPKCTITGTEMVTVGQAGTITVSCNGDYGITTTQLTKADLDYSGNILVSNHSTAVPGTSTTKTFTFTFTGNIAGVSNLGLRTGAVMTVPGIVNRYATGNDITVVSGSNGTHYCSWKDPEPSTIGLWGIGTMELDCITDPRIEGFLNNSGTSVAGILSLDNPSGPRVLHYTGTQDGDTQFAISGTIGNVHIQTDNNYWSNPIQVISSAPVCSVSYNPDQSDLPSGWTSGNVIATLTCPEGVTITSAGGNTHLFTANGTFNFEYTDGVHVGGILANVTWIDKEKPNTGTIIINDNATYTNNPNVTLTLSAIDTGAGMTGGTMRFSCNGSTRSEWETYNTTKNWNLNNGSGCTSGDAYKMVRVQYRDALGNGTKDASDSIRLDTIAPTCNITGNPTEWTNDNVSLTLNYETELHTITAGYSWDGISYSSTKTKTVLSNGIYTGYVKDAAGNIGSCSVNVTNIDKIKPVCTVSTQPTNSPISLVEGHNTGKVIFTCTDTGSQISTIVLTSGAITHSSNVVTLSDNAITGGTLNEITYEFTYTAKAAGYTTLRLAASKVRDNANNVNNASPTSNTIVVDTTTPGTPSCTAGSCFSGSINVSCTPVEGITIHYTTDESNPDCESTTWTNDQTFTTTTTLKAVACNQANVMSDVLTRTYEQDTVGPAKPTLTTPTSGASINDTTPELKWNESTYSGCSPTTSYEIQVCSNSNCSSVERSGTSNTTSWTVNTPLSEGTYYWRVRAKDSLGNNSSRSSIRPFTIDTTAPTVTLTSNGSGLCTTGNTYTITGTFSEPVIGLESGDLEVENGSILTFNIVSDTVAVWTVKTTETSGTGITFAYIWLSKYTDLAGNYNGNDGNLVSREYDFAGPSAPELSSPANNGSVGELRPTLRWNASTDEGCNAAISGYEIRVCQNATCTTAIRSGTTNGSTTNWKVSSNLTEGQTYYWKVRAKDGLGNRGGRSEIRSFTVNTTVPSEPDCTQLACFSGSINVSCTPVEGITIHYTTDESNPDCESTTWTNDQTFTTTTTLKAVACNQANVMSDVLIRTYEKDTAAPSTTANGVPSGWTGNNVTITLTLTSNSGCNSDNTTYYCVANSGSTCIPSTQGTSVEIACDEGTVCEKIVRYYSKDGLGNAETVKQTSVIKIDKKDPVCGGITYTPSTLTKGNVTGSFTASDQGAGLQTTSPQTRLFTDNGTQSVTFTDKVGNSVSCEGNVDWIDKTKPNGEIIITYPSGHLTNGCTSGNVILTLTGSDTNGLATEPYSRDNTNRTGNASKTLTGDEQGTGYIKDAAGNVRAIPYNITGISHSGPSISLSTPHSGSILTGFVPFEWSLEGSTCQALSGGYNIAVYSGTEEIYTGNTGSTTIDTTLPDGTYTWNVSAIDILGHTSTSQTWTLIINSQAPTCIVEYTPAESLGWTSGDVQSVLTGCSTGITVTSADLTGRYLFTGNGTYVFTFINGLGITGNTTATVTRIDKDAPVLHEVTPIGTTTDTTPDYTFSSTESGTIAYSGACSSSTTGAVSGNNTITLNELPVGTYSGCTITVTDKVGNISSVLNISEFTIRSQGGGGGGGGGGGTLRKDYCPDGDYSDSYYDGTCEGSSSSKKTVDICKVNESHFPDEMKLAYLYAYVHGMTTMCPIDDANLYGYLRRDHLAKILSQYSINVLDLEPELGKAGCNDFDDIADESAEMKYFIKTSCELGLMGLESNGKTPKKSFDPTKYVTRAEFGTTLSRLIYEGKYNLASEAENTYPGAWYSKHLQALKDAEIMNEISGDRPQHIELRGYVMLMVMRYGKGRLADMVTDEDANSYYMNNIYTKGDKEMSCTVYSGGRNVGNLYVKGNNIKQYNKTSGVSLLIRNNTLYTWSDSSDKGVSKEYTTSVIRFFKRFDDEEISVQCTQGVDSDELIKPRDITFLDV